MHSFTQGSKSPSHSFEIQFLTPNPGEQQTKNLRTTANRRGRYIEYVIKRGTWTVVITSHSSMLLLVSYNTNYIARFSSWTVDFTTVSNYKRFDLKKQNKTKQKEEKKNRVYFILTRICMAYNRFSPDHGRQSYNLVRLGIDV